MARASFSPRLGKEFRHALSFLPTEIVPTLGQDGVDQGVADADEGDVVHRRVTVTVRKCVAQEMQGS